MSRPRRLERRLLVIGALIGAAVVVVTQISRLVDSSEGFPLQFKEVEIDVGVIETNRSLAREFSFQVWDNGPVRIETVATTCCGPAPFNPDLTGLVLEPGSEHAISLALMRSFGEMQEVVVHISTDPPSRSPITLTLKGMLLAPPHAHPNPVVLRPVLGRTAEATIKVSRLRTSHAEQLELEDAAVPSGMECELLAERTVPIANPHNVPRSYVDEVEIALRTSVPALAIGENLEELVFTWSESHLAPTTIPMTVVVEHPYRPVAERFFVGRVRSGARVEHAMRMVRNDWSGPLRVSEFEVSDPALHVDLISDGSLLRFQMVVPDALGRLSETVRLVYDDERVPAFDLLLTGEVVE
jgi:hypothetical protein